MLIQTVSFAVWTTNYCLNKEGLQVGKENNDRKLFNNVKAKGRQSKEEAGMEAVYYILAVRLGTTYLVKIEIFFVESTVDKSKRQLKQYSGTNKQYQKVQ